MNGRGWAKDCTSEELRAVFSTYGTVMVSGLSLLQNVNSWNMIGINWNWKVISMSGTINCCFMLFLTMLLRWHMCMSHRRCFSTKQSGFFVAPLLDTGNQDFNVSVANDVEIGLTTLHIETSTWQVMNPHPRTGQRPGFCGTTWFCPRQMKKWLKWITGHRWFLRLRGAHLSSMRPGRLEMMLVKSKTQIFCLHTLETFSTILYHFLLREQLKHQSRREEYCAAWGLRQSIQDS